MSAAEAVGATSRVLPEVALEARLFTFQSDKRPVLYSHDMRTAKAHKTPEAWKLCHVGVLARPRSTQKSSKTLSIFAPWLLTTSIVSHQDGMAQVHVVFNEASGASGLTARLLNSHVLPALEAAAYSNIQQHDTQAQGDGQRIGREIRSTAKAGEVINLILLGGDGTTGEVINGLFESPSSEQGHQHGKWKPAPAARIALVPTGTANALYAALYASSISKEEADDEDAWRLKSLKALLHGDEASLQPLTLSAVCVQLPSSGYSHTLAHIVTSQALHAAILRDSEALRASHPGVERFRIAAAQNSIVWHAGELTLLGDGVSQYDPTSRSLKSLEASKTLQGPFLYVAALSQDRLEPTFIPAPFANAATRDVASPLARPQDQLDIALIRPLRDPNVAAALGREGLSLGSSAPQHIREAFARGALASITKGMYDGGKHVDLRYPSSATAGNDATEEADISSEAQGETAVEYYRAQGYAWSAVSDA